MRLTTAEVAALIESCKKFAQGMNAELRLFGHRVSDYDQGDDIGLMLIVENETDEQTLMVHKPEIIGAIIHHIGDNQPVDVIVTTRSGLRHHPVAHDLLPDSMFLYAYKAED